MVMVIDLYVDVQAYSADVQMPFMFTMLFIMNGDVYSDGNGMRMLM